MLHGGQGPGGRVGGERGNVMVVGDDDQCLAEGTRVRMADGSERPIEQVRVGDRVRTALGRVCQFEFMSLKRAFKIDGMSEAAIHEIIPDRPVSKKSAKKPAGSSGDPT